ncbi:MAG: response regulator [Ignavibacteriales bacterium]|nr:MAG: response regulator [Ignavibacteriales bacterium]
MDTQPKILIIDDENQIRKILKIALEAKGYKIIEAANGNEGVVNAATNHPELIILDLGLPDKDGISVLKDIREWSQIPIIILTVRNAEEDIINALNSGADDYLTKPFNTGELIARINANLRRSAQIQNNSIFINGPLKIDLVSHIASNNDQEIKLTATEYSLLVLFAKNIGKVLTHRFILKEIWGPSYIDQSQYLRVFVGQLRKKIEEDPSNPKMIVTESGVGYRMVLVKEE